MRRGQGAKGSRVKGQGGKSRPLVAPFAPRPLCPLTPMTVLSSTAPSRIDIQVSMSQPWTHYFEVAMTITGIAREYLDLVMPVWTPGSYMIREFSRHVRDFVAMNESGERLAWEKTNKNTWRIQSKQESRVLVQYRVYAFELSVRTSFLDDTHGYINGASVFMYVDGL